MINAEQISSNPPFKDLHLWFNTLPFQTTGKMLSCISLQRNKVSLWLKFWFSNPYLISFIALQPKLWILLFKSYKLSLKYQRFTPSGFKDIDIRKCVTKTRLIYDIRWLFTSLNLCILITITLNYIIIKEILQYSNLIIFFYHYTFFIVFYVGYIFMHRRARYLFPVLSIVTECI